MIKDLLKTMLAINNDTDLNTNEKCLLSSLILYHNPSYGYAFPAYDQLKIALSTKRNETVSKYIKSLVEKDYIIIKKIQGNKSIYFINRYLYFIDVSEAPATPEAPKKNKQNPVDSNGQQPLKDQIHIDEVVQENPEDQKVIQISDYTGFSKRQSRDLLKDSGNDAAKVIRAFDHMRSQNNIKDEFKYTRWAIKNASKVKVEFKNPYKPEGSTISKFNNFDAREYDYNSLENALLGWDKPKDISEYVK